MNRKDLIDALAETTNVTKVAAAASVNAIFGEAGIIPAALELGEDVALVGFGTFSVNAYAEKKGVNPATKEPMTIPAGKRVTFKSSKGLKDKING
jgi:DNA-binding protein HU-beta